MFGVRGSYRHAATRSSAPSLIGSKTIQLDLNTVVTTSNALIISTDRCVCYVNHPRHLSCAIIRWRILSATSIPSFLTSPSSGQILSICIYPSGYLPDSYWAVRRYHVRIATPRGCQDDRCARNSYTLTIARRDTISSSSQWALRPANLHCLPRPSHRPCKPQEEV